MRVSDKEIDLVAEKAGLFLNEKEESLLRKSVCAALDWIEEISYEEGTLSECFSGFHVGSDRISLREDRIVKDIFGIDDVFQNASVKKKGFFVVPLVVK